MTTGGTRGAGHAGFPSLSENAQQPLDHCRNRGWVGGGRCPMTGAPVLYCCAPRAPQAAFSAGPVHEQRHLNFHLLTNKFCQKIRCRSWLRSAKRRNRISIGVLFPAAVDGCSNKGRMQHVSHVGCMYSMSRGLTVMGLGSCRLCRSQLGSTNRCWGIVQTKNIMLPW